jgi:hypothetical protein
VLLPPACVSVTGPVSDTPLPYWQAPVGAVRLSSSGTPSVLRLPTARPARFTLRFAFGYPGDHLPSLASEGRPPPIRRALDKPVCPDSGMLPEDCRISQVPMEPLHQPFPVDSHLRPALRPRSSVKTSPSRPRRPVPGLSNAKDLDNASISGLNHTARCMLSTLHAALTERLCKTRLWLAVNLYHSRSLTGWVPTNSFNHRLPIR